MPGLNRNEQAQSMLHGDDENYKERLSTSSSQGTNEPFSFRHDSGERLNVVDAEFLKPSWRKAGSHLYTRRRTCVVLLVLALAGIWAVGYFTTSLLPLRPSSNVPPPPDLHPAAPNSPSSQRVRKAIVIAGYKDQGTRWIENLSPGWEVFNYINDDPNAKYRTPRNWGHEAMHYLTFIIDEYYRLPDYVVFLHGHRRAWHQPEFIEWKLDALNFTALDQDQFINFRCPIYPDDHVVERAYDLNNMTNATRPAHKLVPLLWNLMELGDLPTALHSPCCSQFAVTKQAIRQRDHTWWEKFRRPMMEDLGWPELDNNNQWGFVYEQMWHVAFGMNPWLRLPQDYCFKTQWSNAIWCNMYPTPPLGDHPKDVVQWANVECFKNDNNTQDWEIKRLTAANFSDIIKQKNQENNG